MIKKITKGFLVLTLFSLLLMPFFYTDAQGWTSDHYLNTGSDDVYLDENLEPRDAATAIINLVLSFLGIVAVAVILVGGFKWMTAGGNDEKVGAAKKLLIAGIIGLVIVLIAWGLVNWVLTTVPDLVQ